MVLFLFGSAHGKNIGDDPSQHLWSVAELPPLKSGLEIGPDVDPEARLEPPRYHHYRNHEMATVERNGARTVFRLRVPSRMSDSEVFEKLLMLAATNPRGREIADRT